MRDEWRMMRDVLSSTHHSLLITHYSSLITPHSSLLWNRRALVELRGARVGVERVWEAGGVERRAGGVQLQPGGAQRRRDLAPGGGAVRGARLKIGEHDADAFALVERIDLREASRGERPDLLVRRLLVHAPVHLARELSAAAVDVHLRGHRAHPRGRSRQSRARRVSVARLRVAPRLPVDVAELVVEPPRARIFADAFLDEFYRSVVVNRREDDRAELVGGHELRVERRRLVEERAEIPDAERAHVVERELAAVRVNLPTDVLQRAQPVPVGHKTVEAEAHAPRSLRPDVRLFVRRERVLRRAARGGPPPGEEGGRQSGGDHARAQTGAP